MSLFLSLWAGTRSIVGTLRRWGLGLMLVLVLVVGAWLFALFDHRTLGTALYWAVTTASTVGYGDVTPTTGAGRLVAVGVMLTAIPILGLVFANVTGSISEARFRRLLGMEVGRMRGHMVVLGWTEAGRIAVRELLDAGEQVLLVDDASQAPMEHARLQFVRGDPADEAVLARSVPKDAKGALVCLNDDGLALVAAIALRHAAPTLPVAAVARAERTRAAMDALGISSTIAVDALVGHALAKSVESPNAGKVLLSLVDTESYRMAERPPESSEIGQALSTLRQRVAGTLVLGVVKPGGVDLGLDDSCVVEAQDRLVLLTAGGGKAPHVGSS